MDEYQSAQRLYSDDSVTVARRSAAGESGEVTNPSTGTLPIPRNVSEDDKDFFFGAPSHELSPYGLELSRIPKDATPVYYLEQVLQKLYRFGQTFYAERPGCLIIVLEQGDLDFLKAKYTKARNRLKPINLVAVADNKHMRNTLVKTISENPWIEISSAAVRKLLRSELKSFGLTSWKSDPFNKMVIKTMLRVINKINTPGWKIKGKGMLSSEDIIPLEELLKLDPRVNKKDIYLAMNMTYKWLDKYKLLETDNFTLPCCRELFQRREARLLLYLVNLHIFERHQSFAKLLDLFSSNPENRTFDVEKSDIHMKEFGAILFSGLMLSMGVDPFLFASEAQKPLPTHGNVGQSIKKDHTIETGLGVGTYQTPDISEYPKPSPMDCDADHSISPDHDALCEKLINHPLDVTKQDVDAAFTDTSPSEERQICYTFQFVSDPGIVISDEDQSYLLTIEP